MLNFDIFAFPTTKVLDSRKFVKIVKHLAGVLLFEGTKPYSTSQWTKGVENAIRGTIHSGRSRLLSWQGALGCWVDPE